MVISSLYPLYVNAWSDVYVCNAFCWPDHSYNAMLHLCCLIIVIIHARAAATLQGCFTKRGANLDGKFFSVIFC